MLGIEPATFLPCVVREISGWPRLLQSKWGVPGKMRSKPDRSTLWLGKYLSLALTLPASVFAGYLLAAFIQHWVHWSFLPVVGILAGSAAGMIKIIEEVSRDDK